MMKHDKSLREHLFSLLKGGGAHANFDDVVADFRADLEFSRNPKHVSPEWPDGYWPKTESPSSAAAWNNSIKSFRKDLKSMQDLVSEPKADLYAPIPWGDGQTILREALLVADHNAYHLGQIVVLRRLLSAWKE